jgi:hypothetical protein
LPVRDTRLHQPPHRCGFTLRGEDPEGFFIGEVLSGWDPTAAISVSYARSLARELGYVHPDDHAQAIRDRDEARSEAARYAGEALRLQSKLDAIDVIESEGFRARKKAGRPPNTQVKEHV